MNKSPRFEKPVVQGAFDPHHETAPTHAELRIADGGRNPEMIRQEKIDAAITAEPQTPEQLASAQAQAAALAQRYGQNRRPAA